MTLNFINFSQEVKGPQNNLKYGTVSGSLLGTLPGFEFLSPIVHLDKYEPTKEQMAFKVKPYDKEMPDRFTQYWGSGSLNPFSNRMKNTFSGYVGIQDLEFWQVDQNLLDILNLTSSISSKLTKNVPFLQFANYHRLDVKSYKKAVISKDFVTNALFVKLNDKFLNVAPSGDGNVYVPLTQFLLSVYGKHQEYPRISGVMKTDAGDPFYLTLKKLDVTPNGDGSMSFAVFGTRTRE